jgi:hypothetical protein
MKAIHERNEAILRRTAPKYEASQVFDEKALVRRYGERRVTVGKWCGEDEGTTTLYHVHTIDKTLRNNFVSTLGSRSLDSGQMRG